MRRRFSLLALAAVVFLLALLVSAPARLIGMLIPGEQLLVQGLSGTVWDGTAARCLVRTQRGYLHLGKVKWSLRPLSLLLLSPSLEVRSVWGTQRFRGDVVVRGAGDLELQDFQANLGAEISRQFAPVGLVGEFKAQLESLRVEDGLPVSLVGRLEWKKGGWMSPGGPQALGSYAVDFLPGADDRILGDVVTVAGPVMARGTVQLQGRQYSTDIYVGGERMARELRQALSLIAEPQGDEYRIRLDDEF